MFARSRMRLQWGAATEHSLHARLFYEYVLYNMNSKEVYESEATIVGKLYAQLLSRILNTT